jgi:hypothetical protein
MFFEINVTRQPGKCMNEKMMCDKLQEKSIHLKKCVICACLLGLTRFTNLSMGPRQRPLLQENLVNIYKILFTAFTALQSNLCQWNSLQMIVIYTQ